MPKLEIPDLPEDVYQHLAESARKRGVSIGVEAAARLCKWADDEAREEARLANIRRNRERLPFTTTEEEITAAKYRWRE